MFTDSWIFKDPNKKKKNWFVHKKKPQYNDYPAEVFNSGKNKKFIVQKKIKRILYKLKKKKKN